jgi:hypothetical protein
MGGTEVWLPLLLGGMGAAGSMMSGGAEGKLGGYGPSGIGEAPTRSSIDPTLLGNILAPIEQMTGVAAGRARQPVTLPGAFVQPTPMFSGGGMAMPIGTTAVDPALQQPHLMGLPGINTGQGPLSSPYKEYVPHSIRDPFPNQWGAVAQPSSQLPESGGGIPQLQGALELLGVHSDPMGNLTHGGRPLFTGANPNENADPGNTGQWGPTAEAQCNAQPGMEWINGECQLANDPTSTTNKEDCEAADGVWTGSECEDVTGADL